MLFSYDWQTLQGSFISVRHIADRGADWISKPTTLLAFPQGTEYTSGLCVSPKSNFTDLFVACVTTVSPYEMVSVWNAGANSAAYKDSEGKISVSYSTRIMNETPSSLVFSSTVANIILIGTVQGTAICIQRLGNVFMWNFMGKSNPKIIANTGGVRVTSLALSEYEDFLIIGDSNGCIHLSRTSIDLTKVFISESN